MKCGNTRKSEEDIHEAAKDFNTDNSDSESQPGDNTTGYVLVDSTRDGMDFTNRHMKPGQSSEVYLL